MSSYHGTNLAQMPQMQVGQGAMSSQQQVQMQQMQAHQFQQHGKGLFAELKFEWLTIYHNSEISTKWNVLLV